MTTRTAKKTGGHQFSVDFAATTMKRVNIQVPDEIHTRAKVIAVLKDTTLGEYLEQAVKDAVERDRAILERIPK